MHTRLLRSCFPATTTVWRVVPSSSTLPHTRVCMYGNVYCCFRAPRTHAVQGKLVEDFASLLKSLWSQEYLCVFPSKFKRGLIKYKPQFAGNEQQDSQVPSCVPRCHTYVPYMQSHLVYLSRAPLTHSSSPTGVFVSVL